MLKENDETENFPDMSHLDNRHSVFPIVLDPFSGYKYQKEPCVNQTLHVNGTEENDDKYMSQHPLGKFLIRCDIFISR